MVEDGMNGVSLYAAGSLRAALGQIAAAFQETDGVEIEATFGPSGVLRERISRQASMLTSLRRRTWGTPPRSCRRIERGPLSSLRAHRSVRWCARHDSGIRKGCLSTSSIRQPASVRERREAIRWETTRGRCSSEPRTYGLGASIFSARRLVSCSVAGSELFRCPKAGTPSSTPLRNHVT